VTATISPLSREKTQSQTAEKRLERICDKPVVTAPERAKPRAAQPPRLGTTLDASWDRKLRSGAVEPDRILDLHGHNLDSAWRAIDRGLEQAINRGDRLLLLITGHHRHGQPPVQRGKIRAAVHDWLTASRHAAQIAAVRDAHRRHGGGGSLYVILRRNS
jgi:DNA-nicking Smr family endonuclease